MIECELVAAIILTVMFLMAYWIVWLKLIIYEYRRKFRLMRADIDRLSVYRFRK